MSHWTQELFVDQAEHYAADIEMRLDEAAEETEDLLDLLEDDHDLDPDSALDVACGCGRHAVPLAEQDLDVDGVDISPEFVERAGDRADADGVADRTLFVEGDMRDLGDAPLREEYDLVTCFFTSFGYFEDETNREVLAEMADHVAPGGAVVLQLANKDRLLANFNTSSAFEHGGYLVTEQREFDVTYSRVETTRRMFEENGDEYEFAFEGELSIRLYSPVELRKLFEDVGLEPHLYGSPDGEDLDRESDQQYVVGLA
jgi:SAM-dependent methyltransferase